MARWNLLRAARQVVKEARSGTASLLSLDDLERAVKQKFDGSFGALNAPIAPYTWMVRASLLPDQEEALLENITWPGPCEILGYYTTLCTLVQSEDGGQKLPPLEAIDVMFRVDQRETYTSRIDNAQNNSSGSKDVVNAPMMQVLAPRLLGIELVGPQPAVNTIVRWAVPQVVRKYQGWGPTQVSIGFLIRDLSKGGDLWPSLEDSARSRGFRLVPPRSADTLGQCSIRTRTPHFGGVEMAWARMARCAGVSREPLSLFRVAHYCACWIALSPSTSSSTSPSMSPSTRRPKRPSTRTREQKVLSPGNDPRRLRRRRGVVFAVNQRARGISHRNVENQHFCADREQARELLCGRGSRHDGHAWCAHKQACCGRVRARRDRVFSVGRGAQFERGSLGRAGRVRRGHGARVYGALMPAWKQIENGWRTWAKFNGAHWSYDQNSGDIVAVAPDGTAIDTLAAPRLGYARDLVKRYARDLSATVDGDVFYTRGLLGLATVECPPGNLPCPGDCYCKDNAKKLCTCSSDKAGPANALGLYQVSRVAAKDVGVKFDDLGKSADANHAAAFAVAKKMEPTTGKDFVALAAAWNAGGVYPGALPWGARAYRPTTITEYVRGWNAVGQALREGLGSSSSSSSSSGSSLIPVALFSIAIAAANGWKLGRIFR